MQDKQYQVRPKIKARLTRYQKKKKKTYLKEVILSANNKQKSKTLRAY